MTEAPRSGSSAEPEPSLYEKAQAVISDTEFGRVAMREAYMAYRLRTIEPAPFEVFEHAMHIYATEILEADS